jgi:hypothetical protein
MNYVSLHFVFKTSRSDFSALFGALSSYLQYVVKHSEWIDKINRGGLVYPADDFFLLVREMESVMR